MATYVAVFALVLAYVALVAAYLALRTLAKVRRTVSLVARGVRPDGTQETGSIEPVIDVTALTEQLADLQVWMEQQSAATEARTTAAEQRVEERLATSLRDTAATIATVKEKAAAATEAGALRNVALVRYDAFADMSGRLSFSLALLDAGGDGVVLTAIAAGSDTRIYAKGIVDGQAEHDLSPEERQAVRAAVREKRSGLLSRKAG